MTIPYVMTVADDEDTDIVNNGIIPLVGMMLTLRDGIISAVVGQNGYEYEYLIPCNDTNSKIKISSMKCSSYDEFLIALDIHDCMRTVDLHVIDSASSSTDKTASTA